MGRHLRGRIEQVLENLATRVLAQARIVVIQQHLDANGAFDQGHLLVQQAVGEYSQIRRDFGMPTGLQGRLLSLVAPYPAPEVQRITGQCRDQQRTDAQQHSDQRRHRRLRPRGIS